MLLSFLLRRRTLPWLTLAVGLSIVVLQLQPLPWGLTSAAADEEVVVARAVLPTALRGGHERPAADTDAQVPRWDLAERDLQALANMQTYPVAYYIKDLRSGRVLSHRENAQMPSASLVKLPVMGLVYRDIAAGRLTLETPLAVLERHKVSGCGPTAGIPTGQTDTVRNLLEQMITVSDNTATNVLVDAVGMDRVNRACREFGLYRTDMIREVMDLEARDRGVENLTTARDMGEFLEKLERGELIGNDYCEQMRGHLLRCKLRDRLPRFLPEGVPIAHKTGLMYNVVHDVGTLYFRDRTVIVAVLTRDFPSYWVAKEFIGRVAERIWQAVDTAQRRAV